MSIIATRWKAAVAGLLLLGSGCGGGISGSGNGGGEPGPVKVVPGYTISHLPARILLDTPDSLLLAKSQQATQAQAAPAVALAKRIDELSQLYYRFALVQLYADVAWLDIQRFCDGVDRALECDLTDSDISFEYTRDMALWEALLHIEPYELPDEPTPAYLDSIIPEQARAKIGTTIALNAGSYSALDGGQYDHEVALTLPEIDTDSGVLYHISWNDDTSLVQVLVTFVDDDAQRYHLKSLYRNELTLMPQSQQLLYVSDSDDVQNELQFNQYEISDRTGTFVESQFRIIDAGGKTEIYSRGTADANGGFLLSETEREDTNSIAETTLQREVFTSLDAEPEYSYALCDIAVSADECASLQDWTLLQGTEPTDSEFYLAQPQLDELGRELRLFDLTITNVATDADSYLLLKRDNLTVSFTSTGIQLTIPGLGSFSWPPTDEELNSLEANTTSQSLTSVEDSFVCRVVPFADQTQQNFRTFCAALEEDIVDALVVSEFYEAGEFRIEWEANATITINP